MRMPVSPIGSDCKDDPTEIVNKATAKHGPTWNWPDAGAIDKLIEVVCHFRMNRKFAKVSGRLNPYDPYVCTTNAAPCGSNKADVMTRMQVVFCEDRAPALIMAAAFAVQDLRVQMRFHETGPGAPDVEVAIAARLKYKEHRKQHADQNERQR